MLIIPSFPFLHMDFLNQVFITFGNFHFHFLFLFPCVFETFQSGNKLKFVEENHHFPNEKFTNGSQNLAIILHDIILHESLPS